MKQEIYFTFGAMSDPISEQYRRQGYRLANAEKWEKDVSAVVRLYVSSLITDREYDTILNRIIKGTRKDVAFLEDV